MQYTILFKRSEHPQIWVSTQGPRPNPPRIPRDSCTTARRDLSSILSVEIPYLRCLHSKCWAFIDLPSNVAFLFLF